MTNPYFFVRSAASTIWGGGIGLGGSPAQYGPTRNRGGPGVVPGLDSGEFHEVSRRHRHPEVSQLVARIYSPGSEGASSIRDQ